MNFFLLKFDKKPNFLGIDNHPISVNFNLKHPTKIRDMRNCKKNIPYDSKIRFVWAKNVDCVMQIEGIVADFRTLFIPTFSYIFLSKTQDLQLGQTTISDNNLFE